MTTEPRRFAALLTSSKSGLIDEPGKAWPNAPEHYERIEVVECKGSQWIDCRDQMPEPFDVVLFVFGRNDVQRGFWTGKTGDHPWVATCATCVFASDESDPNVEDNAYTFGSVSHWMPLPGAPK